VIDREFDSSIKLSNVCYSYELSGTFQIDEVSLWIPRGSHTALVGPSGAGKSTLVDLILGIINPMKGTIEISGVSPRSAVEGWPLAISYLPQEVCLIEGTVLDNLHFGISSKSFSEDRAWEVLDAVGLGDYLRTEAEGLETLVGERGSRFSGGQRQRLGIARVLYPNPSILVLDEATSALDGQTEALLTGAIQGLRGSVTLITVAHRLSTVVNADQVVYMEGGRIIQTGTFEQVRQLVPNFDIQANLLGL
jgi:ABC-type multidrug transport system fused ATPase/permease subunit